MKAFAALLDRLSYTPGRNAKLRLMGDYFRRTADPDRGWALMALAGGIDFPSAKAGAIRGLATEQVGEELFRLSYDYVGDLAETCALLWQGKDAAATGGEAPALHDVVARLQAAGRAEAPALIAGWLDRLDATERWALLKLVTGALRVGVSARLARTALAQAFDASLDEIEEVWHGLDPPFEPLFAWLAGDSDKPDIDRLPTFRPFMLAHPLEEAGDLDPADWQVEWKWDGIRVQLVARGNERRIYSRTGDDIGQAFPDVLEMMEFEGVVDGEMLVRAPDGDAASFNELQQRLGRKTVSRRMLGERPAFVRAYDLLFDAGEDLRTLPLTDRRERLAAFVGGHGHPDLELSEVIAADGWEAIRALQAEARALGREGLMLKRRDSAYVPGRTKGLWYKWKRDPLTADAVLLYAQRGHGKRSSFYSDYTFGVWREGEAGPELVPVGKAYFGFTDEELRQLDKWVRDHTTNRFGPVREVEKELVFEVAFDSIHPSSRHKSGLAMRFPRISRIRWDKPAAEADELTALERLAE